MNKKAIFLLLCIAIFCIDIFTVAKNARSNDRATQPQQQGNQASSIPEPVIYSILFHFVVDVRAQAKETELSGKDPSSLNSYFRLVANLDDGQARALNEIAAECIAEADKQDRKARDVIDRFRAQFPSGKVHKGTKLPPPPPELQAMQQEKNEILLKYRDKLRASLGETGFENLGKFINEQIVPKVTITPAQKR